MDSFTSTNEAPIGSVIDRSMRKARIPGKRYRHSPTVDEVNSQRVVRDGNL